MSRILVVDDNAANLYLLRTVLQDRGHAVDDARNGAEALDKARRAPPDALISDLLMPVMDGFTLLRHWKADPTLRAIPFVVYTATYTEPQDEKLALELGANAYLVKPTEPEALLARLDAVLVSDGAGEPADPQSPHLPDDPLLDLQHSVVVRKLEKKVRELEDERVRLADALRVAGIGSWTTDPRTMDVAWSDGTHRIFETDPTTFRPTHQRFLELVHPEDRQAVDRALLESLRSRDLQSIEHRIVLPDGRIKHIEERWHVSFDEHEQPDYVLGISRDVTTRRRADAELRESEEQLRRMFANAAIGLAICSLDSRVTECNASFARMLGFANEELRGTDLSAFTHPDDRLQSDALLRELIEGKRTSFVIEKRCVAKNGGIVWSRVSVAMQRNRLGQATGVIHAAEDITQQVAAGEALRRQNALLRIAGRLALIGGWSLDLASRRVSWSDEICVIHDVPRGHHLSLDESLSFYPPNFRQIAAASVEACAAAGTPIDFEAELQSRTGRRVWVRMTGEAVRDDRGCIVALQGALQDVSTQKRAAIEQTQLESRLIDTLESISDAFFTLDRNWNFTYLNREAERMLARSRDDLLGHSIWVEFPEAIGSTFQREYERALAEHRTVSFEEFFAPLGTWFGVRAHPSVHGLAVYFRDVGAARAVEQALRASEERLRLLSRAANEAIQDWDLSSGTLWWNEGFQTLFGYSIAVQTPSIDFWIERIHPDDERRVVDALTRAVESKATSWSGEYRFRCSDGSYIWVLDHSYIMRDASGKPLRVICGLTDLTERRAAEARLVEQAALLDKARDAIFVLDLENRITYWNKGADLTYGWHLGEVLGKSARDLLYGDPAHFDETMNQVLAGGEWLGEIPQNRRDGRSLTIDGRWTLVRGTDGWPHSVLAINTDITERKRLEGQLHQSQKMEAVGQFAGGVAHDFNNLLTVIIGCSEHLASLPTLDDPARDSVTAIREASDRAADLTRKLLSFSRRSILQPKVLDVNAVVRAAAGLLRRLIGDHIQLETVLGERIGFVNFDPTQLDQVLMNFAANARDAMANGGQLTIETAAVTLTSDSIATASHCQPGPHVMLTVTDTGEGMSRDVLAHIFEPFYTTKESGKGTGLGLSTVYGIVRQSGGCIHVDSEPGRGTCFKIYLPTVAAPLNVHANPPARLGTRGEETILLVEDDTQVRRLVASVLQRQGYTVLSAADGTSALDLAARSAQPIDLALTDLIMPNLSGTELAKRLTERFPKVKVLFMSGYTNNATLRQGLLDGQTAFIQKPFTPVQLGRKVREVLDEGGRG